MKPKSPQTKSWYAVLATVGGLLTAILLAGVVGLLLNQRVDDVTRQAFEYDVELADDADDLRAGILELRHYHRNIAFTGASRSQISQLEEAYGLVLEETRELEELGVPEDAAQPEDIRRMAETYYSDFRPAVNLAESDPEAFTDASDLGLQRLAEMQSAAEEIEDLGEERSEVALQTVENATSTARLVLLGAVGGLLLAGAALAYLAVRFVGELRRSYARQREAARTAEKASRAKTDFIADVSHELRTPLTVLRGNAELGLALKEDCSHGEILGEIVKESKKMSSMVEDLLFLARSDSATLPLEKEPIAVEPFLEEVAGRAKMLTQKRGARFESRLSGGGEIEADRERIEQAILVFVDNASKFSPEGETVTLSATTEDGGLRVSVEDRGLGIPEKDLPHVFERFYRVDKSRERKRGEAGLGLPIARTIVEAHGGRIDAESRPGEGTTMTILLPLLAARRPSRPPSDPGKEPVAPGRRPDGSRTKPGS